RRPSSPTLWRVAYPTDYLPTIRTYAGNQVDPYLVASIIREESLYDSKALSRAGAVGLMQIMPATARRLTESSKDLHAIRDELFDQQTNIRLGSHYLGKLLDRFSDNIIHAIAAYNAGPVAVSSWIKRNGHTEPAAFVELIPYRETRGYVKRVLRSYREYHRIGNGGCGARSLDKVC
ncbi:MAG: lytic transglycosylase domain-containing protein, partial [Terriglobia bacterium]